MVINQNISGIMVDGINIGDDIIKSGFHNWHQGADLVCVKLPSIAGQHEDKEPYFWYEAFGIYGDVVITSLIEKKDICHYLEEHEGKHTFVSQKPYILNGDLISNVAG